MQKNMATHGVRKTATSRISALGQQLISQLEKNCDVPVQKLTKQSVVKRIQEVENSTTDVAQQEDSVSQSAPQIRSPTVTANVQQKKYITPGMSKTATNRISALGQQLILQLEKNSGIRAQKQTKPPEMRKSSSNENSITEIAQRKYSVNPSDARPKSDSSDEYTIEHGRVITRQESALKTPNHVEIGEEAMIEYNMRYSQNAEDESASESEDDESQEVDQKKIVPEKKEDSGMIGRSDSVFLPMESENNDEISSIPSTSADDTAEMKKNLVRASEQCDKRSHVEEENLSFLSIDTAERQRVNQDSKNTEF